MSPSEHQPQGEGTGGVGSNGGAADPKSAIPAAAAGHPPTVHTERVGIEATPINEAGVTVVALDESSENRSAGATAAATAAAPTAGPAGPGYGEVLANRHFRKVLFAQFFSNIGGWMEMFAIQMFVAKATGRLDDQGLLGFLQGVPIFLFGVFGGVVADRVNRRTMLVVTQVLAAIVAAGVAVVSAVPFADPRTAVHWLFALGFINGVVMAFNFPAWQVLTPRLVPKPQLTRAITLNGIQFNLARVVGPALAGAVLAQFASTPLFVFNAVSFLAVAVVVMTTPDAPPTPLPAGADRSAVWRQIIDAARFLASSPGPRAVFFAQVYLSLLAAPLVRLLSLYVIDVYQLQKEAAETAAGILLAIQGIGAVAGGFALRLIPPWYPKHHFIPVAVSALGLSIAIFAVTTGLWAGYAVMLVVGFFWIWAFNQSWAAMQVLAPDAMRGRVLSLLTVAGFGATAVGVLAAGWLGELLKRPGLLDAGSATQVVVACLGFPLLFGGLYMLLNRTPEVDGMPRIDRARLPRRGVLNAVLAPEHRPASPKDASP